MEIYLDTNILLSKIKKNDPQFESISRIFEQPDLKFVCGFITILEFESNIHSLWISGEINLDTRIRNMLTDLSQYQQIRTISEFLLNQFPLQIIPVTGIDQIEINNIELNVENTLTMAYNLVPSLRLKTLDIIQLASAFKIKLYQNRPITYFLTEDKMILDNVVQIRHTIGIIPISVHDLKIALQIK